MVKWKILKKGWLLGRCNTSQWVADTHLSIVSWTALPHILCHYSPSGMVKKQLDKIRKNFLWEGSSETHKFHLVKWPKVTQPKSLGGMGIKSLAIHSKFMLMKWLWRYGQESPALWKDVVAPKHGVQSHWCTKTSTAPHGVG